MKSSLLLLLALLAVLTSPLHAQVKNVPLGVPRDAVYFKGKWYRVYIEKATAQQARDKCRYLGGQLACIHDAPTQNFVVQFSKNMELWIGASDEKTEGLWVWADGTEMKYSAWGKGEPGGGRSENFATLRRGVWIDVGDHSNAVGYICEWKDR